MKIETYRKGIKLKYFGIGVVVSLTLLIPLVINTTKAKYQTSESVPLTRGTVNYKVYDFKIMAMYQENESGEYDEVEVMPSSVYVINEDKSYCYTTTQEEHDDTAVLYTDSVGQHVVGNLKKNSKCYLWFDEKPATSFTNASISTVLADYTKSIRSDFSTVFTTETKRVVYTATDDDGPTYYFAGAATDNYVYFAGFYWRIIRVNGDGTIRMIYDGTTARENGTSSADTRTETSAFDGYFSDNAYVGFMYGTIGASTYEATHANTNNSTIKKALDTWYTLNLSSYASYIDTNAGFCGDRTSTTAKGEAPDGTGGTGTTATYYGAYYRLYTNKTPSLKCTNSSDLYTVSGASKGNKSLSKPIGLISADEVSYAGGRSSVNNKSYYLYTGYNYWTMSPYYMSTDGVACVFTVYSVGYIGSYNVVNTFGVRPVINLKSDVTLTGDGTSSSPFTVS